MYVERHGPEATHRLEDLVAEAKRGSPLAPVTVVGPSRYANIALRRALSREKGLVNVRFEVMYSLAEYLVGTKVAGLGGAPLLWPAELAAIRATSAEVDPNGPLGSVAQHSRLHRSLRGTFRELDRLTEPARQRLEGADALRSEILRWYRRYRQRVEGLYDREDVAREAARAVSAGKAELALRESGRVIFHLPHRLSPAERGLVEALHWSGRCDVVLGFVGEEGTDAAVRGLAGNLWPDQTSDVGIRADDGPMSTITHILSAPDTHEEIRWVIRRILRDAERGIPFHRMAVLFRQAHPYAQLIAGQLEFAGVPAAGPKLRPLRDTPPGKLIALLQMAVAEDFSRDSVLRWVAEAPVRGKDASRPAYDELNMWEIISRQAGIVGGVDQWLERLAAFRQRTEGQIESSGDLEEITPAAQAGLRQVLASAGRLEDFITKLRDDATPPSRGGLSSYSEWAKTLLREYAHDVDHWPEEHRESLEAIEKRLDEIAVLSDRFSEAGPADFNLLLEEALGIESGILGRVGSGVFVGLLEAAQCMDFETVYLVGMAEGAFPPSVGDDAMLPDRLRGDLDGDQTLDRRTTREAYERRGYLAALAACCTAVLSYPRAEPSGQRAQYPSPWILEAARGLHGAPVSSAELARHSSQNWLTLVESAEHGLEYVQAVAAADEHDYDLAAVREWGAARRSLEDHYLAAHEPLARAIEMERARASRRFHAVGRQAVGDRAGQQEAEPASARRAISYKPGTMGHVPVSLLHGRRSASGRT